MSIVVKIPHLAGISIEVLFLIFKTLKILIKFIFILHAYLDELWLMRLISVISFLIAVMTIDVWKL